MIIGRRWWWERSLEVGKQREEVGQQEVVMEEVGEVREEATQG